MIRSVRSIFSQQGGMPWGGWTHKPMTALRSGSLRTCLASPASCLSQEWNKQRRMYSSTSAVGSDDKKTVPITYIQADGSSKTVDAKIGMDLMNVAHENDIELEGACGGELACSTCHLIFEKEIYDGLPKMEEEELDMLDLAFEVTDTSRLGCQIIVKEDFAGMTVKIPDDGF